MTLKFPETSEDLGVAFNNAISTGAMQRDHPDGVTFWGRHELLAHDAEDGVDVFINQHTKEYLRVPRTEVSK